jgi:hypothetical protein
MNIEKAEVLLTIYNGHNNHKTIFWDTYDKGDTVSFSIIDRTYPGRSAIDVLNLNVNELGDLVSRLKDLQFQMLDNQKYSTNG